MASGPVTHQDVTNAIEAVGQRAVSEAQRVARQEIARRALQLIDAIVVSVDSNNRIVIHRHHNDMPDPAPYQIASPAVMPKAGDRVFGAVSNGALILWGVEPGPGYVDVNGVRSGNLIDFSLLNSKFADNSQNQRTIATDGVAGPEIAADAVGASEVGDRQITGTTHIVMRSVDTGEIALDAVQSGEVGDNSLLGDNIATNTITSVDTADNTFGDLSIVDNGLSSASLSEDSVYGSEIVMDAVGTVEIMENCINDSQVADDTLGSGSLENGLNNPGHNTYGLRSLYGGTSDSAAGGGHRHSGNDTLPYWIDSLSMDERDEWLETKHRVEAIDASQPLQGQDLSDLIGFIAHTHSMLTSNLHHTAEELQDRLRNDRDYRHEFLMEQDEGYYARWWYTHDASYRLRAEQNPYVLHALEHCESITAKHLEFASPDRVEVNDDWIAEKLAEKPYERYGIKQAHEIAHESEGAGMAEALDNTAIDMNPDEMQAWLDDGNTFTLLVGSGRHVARKLEDGSYVVYHYHYSTFSRLQQYSARHLSYYSENEPEEEGEALRSLSVRDMKARLDDGQVFTAPISNGENFKIARMPDGAYFQYIPQRETFEAAYARMAQYGPFERWEKSDEYGEPPSVALDRPEQG